MSNLTFSGMRTLKERTEDEDQNKKRHPFDLQKYQHILKQIFTTHQFDIDLENRLNQLDQTEQSRPTHDKSTFLNKQYAKYLEKGSELQLSKEDCMDPEDDVCTHKQTKLLLNLIKGRPIKFVDFIKYYFKNIQLNFKMLSKNYNLKKIKKIKLSLLTQTLFPQMHFNCVPENKEQKVQLKKSQKKPIKTQIEQKNKKLTIKLQMNQKMLNNYWKKNKLCKSKKRKNLSNMSFLYKNLNLKCLIVFNRYMIFQVKLWKNNINKNQLIQIQSLIIQNINQNQKLNLLNLKVLQYRKIITATIKKYKDYNKEIIYQRNKLKLKKSEFQNKKRNCLQKKITQFYYKKKLEKINQKLQDQKEQIKEQIYHTKQNESLQSLKKQQQQIIEQFKQQQQQQQQGDQQKKTINNQENQTIQIEIFQSVFEQIFFGLEQIQIQLSIDNKKWNQEILPCCLQDNLIYLLGNLMQIVINKQGFLQIYKLLLQLSYFYFQNTCTTINCQKIEEVIQNQKSKQTYKYYIGIHDSINREFIEQLKGLLDKKKKNQALVGFLLLLYEKDISYSIKYLSQEICIEEIQKFILDNGLLDVFVIKRIDDRNMVQLLVEIIAQGQYQNQFLKNLIKHFEILLTLLNSQDLEFCEQLSIVLQIVYYNKQNIQNNFRVLSEKKMNCDSKFELLQ